MGYRFSLDLKLWEASDIKSTTHAIAVIPEEKSGRVRLKDGEVLPDRDLVLLWKPLCEEAKPLLHVYTYSNASSNNTYFLAQITPPSLPPERPVPREVIILIDHSGSMEGAKWEAADWAVVKFLRNLKKDDIFNLGVFHSDIRWFSRKMRKADSETIDDAISFLKESKDSGGTELGVALEQSLDFERMGEDFARHVMLVTDAEVSDEDRILRLLEQEAKRRDRFRTSIICIDSSPNSFLAHMVAQKGGGMAKFLTSDPGEEDITTALDRLLSEWAQPVMTGLKLKVDRADVEAIGHRVENPSPEESIIDIGDMPSERTIWLVSRVPCNKKHLTFRLMSSQEQNIAEYCLDSEEKKPEDSAVKTLFGAGKILQLELLMNAGHSNTDVISYLNELGYDKESLLEKSASSGKIYMENIRNDAASIIRGLLVKESLEYGLTCSETAMVAVRSQAGKIVEETALIPNALPRGWSHSFLSRNKSNSINALTLEESMVCSCMSIDVPCYLRRKSREKNITIFSGIPAFENGNAVLFDSEEIKTKALLPEDMVISGILVDFPDGTPEPVDHFDDICLCLFVDDTAWPKARIRLKDLLQQGGMRPLNILRTCGCPVYIVLEDKDAKWPDMNLKMRVVLKVS